MISPRPNGTTLTVFSLLDRLGWAELKPARDAENIDRHQDATTESPSRRALHAARNGPTALGPTGQRDICADLHNVASFRVSSRQLETNESAKQ